MLSYHESCFGSPWWMFFFLFFFSVLVVWRGGCSHETINLPPVRQDGGSVRRAVEKNSECFVALIEKQSSRVTTRKLAFTGLLWRANLTDIYIFFFPTARYQNNTVIKSIKHHTIHIFPPTLVLMFSTVKTDRWYEVIDVLYSDDISRLTNKDMRDMSADLSREFFYCLCPLFFFPPAGKWLHIQMISPIEFIAVSLGRELKDEHHHGQTHAHLRYTMDKGSHHHAVVVWQRHCFCLLLLAG